MNPLDGIILGILLFFLIIGAMRGWFRQVLQIATIAGSFVIASLLHLKLSPASLFDGIRLKSDAGRDPADEGQACGSESSLWSESSP